MKKTYGHGLFVVLATVISACGPTDTTDINSDTQAPSPSTSLATVPADLLRAAENIGAELELRQGGGVLTDEWAEIWSNAQATRQQSQIKTLITRIRSAAPDDALTVESEVLERYFQSYDPVFLLLDQQYTNGTLDAKLTKLRASALGAQVSAQRTFCCRVTTYSGGYRCHEWDTFGAWAARKCVQLLGWGGTGVHLERRSCSEVSGCR